VQRQTLTCEYFSPAAAGAVRKGFATATTSMSRPAAERIKQFADASLMVTDRIDF
jgi:hypothetical protein